MSSSSIAPEIAVAATAPPSRVWLRIALLAVAGFESFLGLGEFSGAFDLHNAPLSFGQFAINARLAIHPFFAVAAFLLAAFGYLRAAIVVLASYILVAWLTDLPTIARFGIEWDWSVVGLSLFAQQLIFPVLAAVAIVLARSGLHLWLGALFVALPPVNLLAGIIAFAIAVMIYGF
jgi:hypothetical protein